MKKANRTKPVRIKTASDLGKALGLTPADAGEIDFRSELTVELAKIIRGGELTHEQIAQEAGTSRTRVTAIANGNTQGISTDLLIRVLSATGHRVELRIRKTAA